MSNINYNLTAEDLRKCADKIIAKQNKEEIEKAKNFLYSTLMPFLFQKANEGHYSYSFDIVRSSENYFSFIFPTLSSTQIVSLKYLDKVLTDLGFFVNSSYLDIFNDQNKVRIFISWEKDNNYDADN